MNHPIIRVQAALDGQEDDCIAITEHSVLLLGEHQFYPGYCVLYARNPVKELHHMAPHDYLGFLVDLRRASAALEAAYEPWKINLASLGNQVQFVHMHLFPRYLEDTQRLQDPWVHRAEFKAPQPAQVADAVKRLKRAWATVEP